MAWIKLKLRAVPNPSSYSLDHWFLEILIDSILQKHWRGKTLLYRLLVELFFLTFTEIFLGGFEWRSLIFLFKKNCQITCFSASDLLCDDTSAWFLFFCSGTSSCLQTWWRSSLQDRDCTFRTLCCRLGPAWWFSTRCQTRSPYSSASRCGLIMKCSGAWRSSWRNKIYSICLRLFSLAWQWFNSFSLSWVCVISQPSPAPLNSSLYSQPAA